ncbi:MAG: FCD domain-containing protein [Propionibacteriales bacterium]|nr:FCD domain-containing protein [Propionibacteriales bacterium]
MSAVDEVVERLREAILSNTFAPGTRLTQSDLATRFGVSRIPVREALSELAAEGLVTLAGRSGAVVASLSLDDLQELYELRGLVEPFASRLAVPNVGRAQMMRMHDCLRRMDQADDRRTWLAANAEFHGQVYKQSGRPRMITTIESLRKQTDRYVWLYLERLDAVDHTSEEHRGILAAVERQDAEEVERATRSHLVTSHEMILQQLLEQELTPAERANKSAAPE